MKKIIRNCALTVLLVFTSSQSFASNVLLDMDTGNTSNQSWCCWTGETAPSYGSIISPASDMNVGSFSFQMRKDTNTDNVATPFTAYIYESNSVGVLSGSAIAQSNETISTNSSNFTEVKAELTSTVTLSSGSDYTLIFNVVGVSGANSDDYYIWELSNVGNSQVVGNWYSNDSSDGISNPDFYSENFALKVYEADEADEADVMVVKKSRGTGPGGKDLNFFEHLVYFNLTQVLTDIPSPS